MRLCEWDFSVESGWAVFALEVEYSHRVVVLGTAQKLCAGAVTSNLEM